MHRLKKPIENTEDVFDLCISKVKNKDLKQRLINCKPNINIAVNDYEIKAPNILLHEILKHSTINGNVRDDEMIKVYTDRMVGMKSPGRVIYEKIINSAPNNICPLCGQRIVNTLDHHLPKADFPVYSVVPINLIPACTDCNKAKLGFTPNSSNNELIHPYFDNFEDEMWLYAKVIESSPVSVKFYTIKPENWDDIKYERIINHFEILKLEKLYASHSGAELASIQFYIQELFKSEGKTSVKHHLEMTYKSKRNVNLNSWETAFYLALSNSEWYQKGGFDI